MLFNFEEFKSYTHPNMPQNNYSQSSLNALQKSLNPYLSSRPLQKIPEQVFNQYLASSFNPSDLQNLKQTLETLNINMGALQKPTIGLFKTLSQLLETTYACNQSQKTEMMYKYSILSEDIFRYRTIRPDGNCFYRAVMFSYFEQIILFNELQLLKNVIFDIQKCNSDPEFKNFNIKLDVVLKILVLIHTAMKKNKTSVAYDMYMKSWVGNNNFDLGLIAYFKFIMYKFIRENEDKFYTKEFAVKIGNLLPVEYETQNGKFLFNKFYHEFLLKMEKDAEKIIVYLTPFVLSLRVEIVMFDCDYDFRKSFNFDGDKNFVKNANTSLLNRKDHYELIYTKEFYSIYYDILKNYTASPYVNKVLTEIREEVNFQSMNLINLNDNPMYVNNNMNNMQRPNMMNNNMNVQMNRPMNNMPMQMNRPINNYPSNSLNLNVANTGLVVYNSNIQTGNYAAIPRLNYSGFTSNQLCLGCKKNPSMPNSNIQLCQNCFITELKSQITKSYLKLTKNLKVNFMAIQSSLDYANLYSEIFNKEYVTIFNNQLNVNNAIGIVNKYLNNFNKINLISLLSEFKNKYCLHCQKSLLDLLKEKKENKDNKEKNAPTFIIKLPCGCILCSVKCLTEFFSEVNKIDIKKKTNDFSCPCSAIYQPFQILTLFSLFYNLKLDNFKNETVRLYQKITFNNCAKCQIDLKNNKIPPVYVKCKNDSFDPNLGELTNKVNIVHVFCPNCNANNGGTKNFFCNFCKTTHSVVGNSNSYFGDCIIMV